MTIFRWLLLGLVSMFLSGCGSAGNDNYPPINSTKNETIPNDIKSNKAPKFTISSTTIKVNENQTKAITLSAVDDDNDTLTYSITGNDAEYFDVNNSTGVITFKTPPNYEMKTSPYIFCAIVKDGKGDKATQKISIQVIDINDAPLFESSSVIEIDENQINVITLNAIDEDNDILTYSIKEDDAEDFYINNKTGKVTFKKPADYESGKTSYTFVAIANDGTTTTDQKVTIKIKNINDAPQFTDANTTIVNEGQIKAIKLKAKDDENDTITYSITGADSDRFDINSSTGMVTFKAKPEYDYKQSFTFTATASDGTDETNQTFTIKIDEVFKKIINLSDMTSSGDVNWGLADGNFTSGDIYDNQQSCMELNSTIYSSVSFDWSVSSDENHDFLKFYINGHEEENITGEVKFIKKSYKLDPNSILKWCYMKDDNISLGNDNGKIRDIKLGFYYAPTMSSISLVIVNEENTSALKVGATDPNKDIITYSIAGADADSFDINSSTGVVTFRSPPSFDTTEPSNNIYHIVASASDGVNIDDQNITIFIKSKPFYHHSIAYRAITSPYTHKIWIDRNLGASRACLDYNDTKCYGDYYQWGRNADGHEKPDSNITSTEASDVYQVGHGDFIAKITWPYDVDWAQDNIDDNGSKRQAQWNQTDGKSICPTGYRVPTSTELKHFKNNTNNNKDAFNSFLRVPSAGYRSYKSGNINLQGVSAHLWLLDTDGLKSMKLFFGDNKILLHLVLDYRSAGLPVRCIKD